MTRTEQLLYRRRGLLWIVAALLFLGGGLALAFLQIGRAESRANQLAAEADLRGGAVSTLAGDVRVLRAQIQAKGETPAAPDPARAVEDLPGRAAVPVPIPGPVGPAGSSGEPGKPAPTITPAPGQPGEQGQPGQDSTVPGPAGVQGPPGADSTVPGPQGEQGPPGPAGADGTNGKDGVDGRDGQACPDGYNLQPPPGDPDALVCRRGGAPAPEQKPGASVNLGLDPFRRQYP
ncbi:collagen-like protein [Streptomyces scopuliridis]|uniref:collagen-like protein n=1 Tax=Streptomyces scopuliridis TaxID=452529 RepID=UPI0036B6FB94